MLTLATAALMAAGIGSGSSQATQPASPAEPAPTSAPAASAPAPASQPTPWNLTTTEQLTGDWGGARTWLRDSGIEVGISLTTIYQHDAHGGANTHKAHDVSGSSDYEVTADLGTMKLIPGGTLYVHAESSWGKGVSPDVGDLFGVNGDAVEDRSLDVTELWYEQAFFDESIRIRVGKMDSGLDFDTNAYANDETTQFMNSGLINTGNLPFPDYGLGIQAIVKPCEFFYFGAGVWDAEADGRETGFNTAFHGSDYFLSMYELGFTPSFKTARGPLPGAYRFGMWYDPQPKAEFFNDLNGRIRTVPMRRDDLGVYMSFDQLVWKEVAGSDTDTQGLGIFCRYGHAREDVNTIHNVWSVGGQYQGLIPTRDDDVLAFGVAQGILTNDMRTARIDPRSETVLELYYGAQVLPWITISPDFQWILDPGGLGGRDAFVAGLRIQASF